MKHIASIAFVATAVLCSFIAIAFAAPPLTQREKDTARQLFAARCVECHTSKRKPQIIPEKYTDQKWTEWYGKMKLKAKLTPDEDNLLSRYFSEVRTASRQPNHPAPPVVRPVPTPQPAPPPQPVFIPPPQPPAPVARKPYFGIILRDLSDNTGVSVVGIADDSPAIEAGLDGGDTILSFNGRQVKSARELQTLFDAATPDDTVTLDILRDDKTVTVTIKVGSKP